MALSGCFFIDCNDSLPNLRTTVGLTPALATFPSNPDVVPFIVYLAEYPNTCWRVSKAGTPVTNLAYNVLNTYSQCVTCIDAIPPVVNVYILRDCLEVEDPIYSFTSELADAVGQVVKLEGSDLCWGVSTVAYDEQTITAVTIATNDADVPQIFDDCECCLPAPEPTPAKYVRVIPKPDRKFYQIKQSQCDITANIRFAEGYYRLFKQLKHGIDSMCDNINLEKLWIKKNLSDLAMINDTTACVITSTPVAIVCPEPKGNPYVPPETLTYYYTVTSPFTCNGVCLSGTPTGPNCQTFFLELDYDLFASIPIPGVTFFGFNYNGAQVWAYAPFITPCEPINAPCTSGSYPTVTGITSSNISYTNIPAVEGVNPCLELFGG
jgi:hypothetical protein